MATQIKTILDNLFTQQNNWQLQLLHNWPAIIGSIKTTVQLLKIYPDTLVIGVLDSCWLQELYMLSPLLIQTINEKLDQPRIKKLRFKTIGIHDKKIKKERTQKKAAARAVELTHKEQAILATIADEQLRAALKEYLIRCYHER